jgi:ATP-binding protein involved in chromosome partitioning
MRLLGVVENMSGDIFGAGGGEALAAELDVPLLGRVPLDSALREHGIASIDEVDLAVLEPDGSISVVSREPRRGQGRRRRVRIVSHR